MVCVAARRHWELLDAVDVAQRVGRRAEHDRVGHQPGRDPARLGVRRPADSRRQLQVPRSSWVPHIHVLRATFVLRAFGVWRQKLRVHSNSEM